MGEVEGEEGVEEEGLGAEEKEVEEREAKAVVVEMQEPVSQNFSTR